MGDNQETSICAGTMRGVARHAVQRGLLAAVRHM